MRRILTKLLLASLAAVVTPVGMAPALAACATTTGLGFGA